MISPERIRRLESFSYLWDREGTWVIDQNHTPVYKLDTQFSGFDGPTVSELVRMRQLLPELAHLTPRQAKAHIGASNMYTLGEFIGQAGRHLLEAGRAVGLTVLSQYHLQVSYALRHPDGIPAPVLDSNGEWKYVIQKMRDAGRPVSINETD